MTDSTPSAVRAAQYVRMSTDRQQLSIALQTAANAAYALAQGYALVRTYADEGVSGLRIEKREGLRRLIADVVSGTPGFSIVLVYDVSRWGRFQNPDEAAHYEFLCAEAGVRVEYCAEPFANDDSLTAIVLKGLKRAMAAEYSRDLSVKIRAAHRVMLLQGYWASGAAGYGYRREMLTRAGRVLGVRGFKQGKEQGARTRLVRGPDHEVAVVQRIFRQFVRGGLPMTEIARQLNAQGIASERGRWSAAMVRTVLTSERYVGRLVVGRSRTILGGGVVEIAKQDWVRIEHGAPRLVSERLWRAAQSELHKRKVGPDREDLLRELRRLEKRHGRVTTQLVNQRGRYRIERYIAVFSSLLAALREAGCTLNAGQVASLPRTRVPSSARSDAVDAYDRQILAGLRALLVREGVLTREHIRREPSLPRPATYVRRFGSLARAYALAGYRPDGKQRALLRRCADFADDGEWDRLAVEADLGAEDGVHIPPAGDRLLRALRDVLEREGRLSHSVINRAPELPTGNTVARRLGGLRRAYALVGYTPDPRQAAVMERMAGQRISAEDADTLRSQAMSQ